MAENNICSQCNTPNRKDARFCANCGQPFEGEVPTLQSPAPPAVEMPVRRTEATGTQPLPAASEFMPRPMQAIFGDRFKSTQHIFSDEQQNGYLVEEISADDADRITRCPNSECGAIHSPNTNGGEEYCTQCRAAFTNERFALLLFEARAPIFGNAVDIASCGFTHAYVRPPVAVFDEIVAQERHYCLVVPYTEALPATIEKSQVFQWGSGLASAFAFLHQNGLTYNGQISQDIFKLSSGRAVIADFNACQIVENVSPESQVADIRALSATLFQWLTGQSQYVRDPGLAPAVNTFFETALKPPGFSNAEAFSHALEDALNQAVPAHPVDHNLGRRTDVGMVRTLNEDSLFTIQFDKYLESIPHSLGVYVVADGMGGHAAGEVASRIIINTIAEKSFLELPKSTENISSEDRCQWITNAVQAANKNVYERGRKTGSDMGSTVVMALVDGNTAHVGHVGDSRAYLVNAQEIIPLTTDHSLVERLIATGQITQEEARVHPQRNVIYRTIGDKAKVEVETATHILNPGDHLLLCSDGLNGMVADDVIQQIVMEPAISPQDACEKLIQAANAAGGDDNISVVLVELI